MSILKKEEKLEVREIVFCNEEENSFCDIFVYEPENVDEQNLGNLYIVGEIVNFSESSSYLVNLLASIIKKEFYSKPKRSTMESLEAGLHKANSTLSNLAEQGNVDWIGNLNMICGAYKKNELYFSQVGNVKTLLVRDNQITDIGKNTVKEEKPHPFKTFANIASGEIEKNDLILLATPEFFNIFSLEKIRQLSSSLDTNKLAETIQNTIEQEGNITTVGLLIMKIGNEKQTEKEEEILKEEFIAENEKESDDSESLKNLESEKVIPEKQAEQQINITNDSKKITLDDIIDKYEKAEVEKQTTEQKFEQKLKSTTEKQEEAVKEFEEIEKEKSVINKSKGLLKILKELFSSLKNSIATKIENYKQKKKDNLENADSTKDQKTEDALLQKINLPSNKNKLIFIAFIFITLLFTGNLIFTNYQEEAERKFNLYNNKLSQAEEKISKAEEVMIYDDLAQARIFLADAKNLTLKVKNDYNKLDEKAENLLGKIQVQLDAVNLVHRIDNPEIAVSLEQPAEQIMLINKKYYASTSGNSVYQIDLENKKAEDLQIKSDDIEHSKLAIPIEKTGEIIFLSDSNKLSSLDLDKKELVPVEIEFINDNPKIKALASYSNYLYFLEPEANQIYKYQRTANGFDNGESWITDTEINIENAISFAIDGFIYILKSDGTADKCLSGAKPEIPAIKDFALEKLSEPLSSSAKIYTNENLEYLYIIDPPKQRIILFNKTNGSLIGQYASDSFADLKNIVVSEMENKMYVLNGDKVFVVGIEREE
ncbi:MAG: hypothetical protein KAQ87_01655 [Candidatus Pacebacteria bacterium]|nr:hypothetical protein [Candidatus Paceibacterota bacterium]